MKRPTNNWPGIVRGSLKVTKSDTSIALAFRKAAGV